jgi:hypothetical protein
MFLSDSNEWHLPCSFPTFLRAAGGFVDMARRPSLSEQQVKRVVTLLASTEMTLSAIAERMTCSKGTIAAINRRFQVRKYTGPKSRWILQTTR